MKVMSNCHNTDREWIPEREPLGRTLARMGAPAPEFDRPTFIRSMSAEIDPTRRAKTGPKIHWTGADLHCVASRQIEEGLVPGPWRIMDDEQFAQFNVRVRCAWCNHQFESRK
jgi:hypothetical protein